MSESVSEASFHRNPDRRSTHRNGAGTLRNGGHHHPGRRLRAAYGHGDIPARKRLRQRGNPGNTRRQFSGTITYQTLADGKKEEDGETFTVEIFGVSSGARDATASPDDYAATTNVIDQG